MSIKNIFSFLLLFTIVNVFGQKYYTKTGEIAFFSKTSMENIDAKSHTASSVIDTEGGKIQWAVLIKSFEFEKSLMQEHFNENYMESSKYPKGKFTGTIDNIAQVNLSKDGSYKAQISGSLEIHGVTKPISTTADFVVKNGTIKANSILKIKLADYNIDIPAVVKDNIAKELEINIKANYEVLDK